MLFLDPHVQELYGDWRRKARAVVGSLRVAVGSSSETALALLRQVNGSGAPHPDSVGAAAN
ncbi:hypothetical protein [Streptomyces sp. NPDC020965]|uniref:MmyB family transcriptional regulator n=1 Tax=Streptomyces sp. NPDC020965 TaxID=3365105 RepID=UPI0037B6AEFD